METRNNSNINDKYHKFHVMIRTFRFRFQVISWDNWFDFATKSDESLKSLTSKRSDFFSQRNEIL